MSTIKLKAKMNGDVCEVKALMQHKMLTGRTKDKAGNPIPAHYITTVEVSHKGKVVVEADWGGGVSENPYLAVSFKGAAAGDEIGLKWTDNKGESASATATVQ